MKQTAKKFHSKPLIRVRLRIPSFSAIYRVDHVAKKLLIFLELERIEEVQFRDYFENIRAIIYHFLFIYLFIFFFGKRK